MSRPTARVVVVGPSDKVLLLSASSPAGHRFWLCPGGGVRDGETHEAAAARELTEETGLQAAVGACVWTRRHVYEWGGEEHDQSERYFVARTKDDTVRPVAPDSYVDGHRWWSVEDIAASDEEFAPRRLAELLPDLIAGTVPSVPVDCGV